MRAKKRKQEIVFKKDKATLHVISKRCEDTKHFNDMHCILLKHHQTAVLYSHLRFQHNRYVLCQPQCDPHLSFVNTCCMRAQCGNNAVSHDHCNRGAKVSACFHNTEQINTRVLHILLAYENGDCPAISVPQNGSVAQKALNLLNQA